MFCKNIYIITNGNIDLLENKKVEPEFIQLFDTWELWQSVNDNQQYAVYMVY